MCEYKLVQLAKFHENMVSLSESIAKSFWGLIFLTHTVRVGLSH